MLPISGIAKKLPLAAITEKLFPAPIKQFKTAQAVWEQTVLNGIKNGLPQQQIIRSVRQKLWQHGGDTLVIDFPNGLRDALALRGAPMEAAAIPFPGTRFTLAMVKPKAAVNTATTNGTSDLKGALTEALFGNPSQSERPFAHELLHSIQKGMGIPFIAGDSIRFNKTLHFLFSNRLTTAQTLPEFQAFVAPYKNISKARLNKLRIKTLIELQAHRATLKHKKLLGLSFFNIQSDEATVRAYKEMYKLFSQLYKAK